MCTETVMAAAVEHADMICLWSHYHTAL